MSDQKIGVVRRGGYGGPMTLKRDMRPTCLGAVKTRLRETL